MGVSKVEIMENGAARTIMDLTGDTVTPEALAEGYTAHNATGEPIHGEMKTTTVLYTEQNLTTEQKAQARDNIGAASISYGICETAADVADKVVTVDGSFILKEGAFIIVRFLNANSIAAPTLNVNGSGAKPMYRYGTTTMSTGTTTTGWVAGAIQMFTYNGEGWIRDYWNNTTYSNVSLGQGYTTCSTAEATVAKTASLSSYSLTAGGIVAVKFTNAVPANATLNINSKGAKAMYYRGSKITADVIKAGDTATFIYSSYYHLISIDRWQDDISELREEIDYYKNYVTPQMFGAKADGVTDDTNAINLAINNTPDGGTVFIPDGVYLVKSITSTPYNAILIENRNNISIRLSDNATIKLATSTSDYYRVIFIKGSENITVSGGRIVGDYETHTPTYSDNGTITGEQGHGIRISDSNNICIKGVDISQCYGDTIVISSDSTPFRGVSNSVVNSCILHDSVRNGITISSAQNLLIKNCEIYNISGGYPMAGIDIENEYAYAGAVIEDITIDSCNIHDNGELSISIARECTNIQITNSTLHPRFTMSAEAENVTISDSVIYNAVIRNATIKNSMISGLGLNEGEFSIIGCKFFSDENSQHNVVISSTEASGKFIGCEFEAPDVQNVSFYTIRANTQAKYLSFNNCIFRLKPIHVTPFGEIGVSEFIGCTFISKLESISKQWLEFGGDKTVLSNCIFDASTVTSYTYTALIKASATNVIVKDCIIKAMSKLGTYAFDSSGSTGEIYYLNNILPMWDKIGNMSTTVTKSIIKGNIFSNTTSAEYLTNDDIEDITREVINALPSAEGGTF